MESLTAYGLTLDPSVAVLEFCPLLAISEHKRSGLILCQAHHAEFAGPGAAIGTLIDQPCTTIIAIGSPEIIDIASPEQRQRAYSRRIQWLRWLQKITDHSDPVQRIEKLFAGFEAFFGGQVLLKLSDEVLAMLAGVLPQTVASARSQHRQLGTIGDAQSEPSVVELTPKTFELLNQENRLTNVSVSYTQALYNLPCSA